MILATPQTFLFVFAFQAGVEIILNPKHLKHWFDLELKFQALTFILEYPIFMYPSAKICSYFWRSVIWAFSTLSGVLVVFFLSLNMHVILKVSSKCSLFSLSSMSNS